MVPSDDVLAMAELSLDSVFGKIPKEKYLYYIESSLQAGQEAADRFAGQTVEQMSDSLGAKIVLEDGPARCGGVNLRAQTVTEQGRTTIHVYRGSLQALAENSAWDGVPDLDPETVHRTHLYHELFHVWEEKRGSYVSDCLETVVTWQIFSHKNCSHVTRCSEIAAHRFAQQMLGLPWLPNFYDYIYLRNQKQLSEDQFADFFVRMQALVEAGKGKSI